MTAYIVTNTIFNQQKVYESKKQINAELGFTYHLIGKLIETGAEKHGYTVDEIESDEYSEEYYVGD